MVTAASFKEKALSFPDTGEHQHFKKIAYRVGKKIFATYDEEKNQASLRLSEIDQSVFSGFDTNAVFPVPNKWGKQGWTYFDLNLVDESLLWDAIQTAFDFVRERKSKKAVGK